MMRKMKDVSSKNTKMREAKPIKMRAAKELARRELKEKAHEPRDKKLAKKVLGKKK